MSFDFCETGNNQISKNKIKKTFNYAVWAI